MCKEQEINEINKECVVIQTAIDRLTGLQWAALSLLSLR